MPNMRNLIYFSFLFGMLFCNLDSSFSHAMILGSYKLNSYLNEPLDLNIELIDAENYDPGNLSVNLANTGEFRHAEIQRPHFLSQLQFEVQRIGKRTFIQVTSVDVMKQPYLDFLVDLVWPGGHLVKSYTIILDPIPFSISKKNAPSQLPLKQIKSNAPYQISENLFGPEDKTETPVFPKEESNIKKYKAQPYPFNLMTSTSETLYQTGFHTRKVNEKQNTMGLFWMPAAAMLCIISLTFWLFYQYRLRKNNSIAITEINTITPLQETSITSLKQSSEILPSNLDFKEILDLKLVLATQYHEIHDNNASKELIQEILKKGDDQQKIKAENLLLKITEVA